MGTGYRESADLIIPSPMELYVEIPVLVLTAVAALGVLPFRTKWVKIAQFPVGSWQIYGSPLAGLTVDVLISNITDPNSAKVVASNVSAIELVKLDQGAAYACAIVKTLNAGGKLGMTYAGAVQAG